MISAHPFAGLKAALILAEMGPQLGGQPLPAERLFDAVNVVLSYQNHDGGWATYENTRSFHALEVRHCCECHPMSLSSRVQVLYRIATITGFPQLRLPELADASVVSLSCHLCHKDWQ